MSCVLWRECDVCEEYFEDCDVDVCDGCETYTCDGCYHECDTSHHNTIEKPFLDYAVDLDGDVIMECC